MMNQQHIEISDRDKFKQILFLSPSNQVVLTIKLLDAAEIKVLARYNKQISTNMRLQRGRIRMLCRGPVLPLGLILMFGKSQSRD